MVDRADPRPDPAVAEALRRAVEVLCAVDARLERGDHPRHVRNYLRREARDLGRVISDAVPGFGEELARVANTKR